jgi:hypothetical protein
MKRDKPPVTRKEMAQYRKDFERELVLVHHLSFSSCGRTRALCKNSI